MIVQVDTYPFITKHTISPRELHKKNIDKKALSIFSFSFTKSKGISYHKLEVFTMSHNN